MIIPEEVHRNVINELHKHYASKNLNTFILAFLIGAAVSGSIILSLTTDNIKDARLEAYEKCLEAEVKIAQAEEIIHQDRIRYMKEQGLINE
jgi:hypothetical protein